MPSRACQPSPRRSLRPGARRSLTLPILLIGLLVLACGKKSDTIVSIGLHPTNPRILYVSTNESVYKTRDGGATWQRMATDLSSYRVLTLAIDPEHPATVYAGTMIDAVYKSPDGGQRWMPYNAGLKEHISVVNQFVFDPRNSETIYVATTVGVFRSTDGGRLWEERMAGMKEVHIVVTLALDPKRPHIFYAGTTGGAYRSDDGTASWKKVNDGLIPPEVLEASLALGVNTLVIDPLVTDTVYAGTTKGLFKTTNRGESWTRIGQSLGDQYVSALLIDPATPQVLYAGGRAGVYKSPDGGQTWQAMNEGLETLNVRTLAMSLLDAQTIFLGTNGSGLYRSQDGGRAWQRIPLVLQPTAPGTAGS
ncbi:MAG: WD40/YVTN/BNR-like repeat-containing protein [Nitrospiraceae bacterium]